MKNKILLLIAVLLLVFTNTQVYAASSDDYPVNTYGNGEYAITNYKIDIKVNENNAFHITEDITAYFNIHKHGIFRKIPLRNEIVRLDGTKSSNRAKISDISVNEQYSLSTEGSYRVIKIGNPDYMITGAKDYTISYLYNIGKDTGNGYDEFYFNLIGSEWDTTISGVEFSITMPKDFDESKLGFSSGLVGSTDSSNITCNVDGNIIRGTYNGVLNPGEALTVRLELPEGYFVGASDNLDLMMLLAIILPIVFALLTFVLWYKFGRDDKVIETVEFYPPEGYNSAEVGFLYKGTADATDIVSLLIYLANKGYIKISEAEEKTLFSKKKGFRITKIKEYDGNNINEKIFLNGLFSFGDSVTAKDLYNSFYITLNKIKKDLNKKEEKQKIFEKSSLNKKIYVTIMIIATFLLITAAPILEHGAELLLILVLAFFSMLGFLLLYAGVVGMFSKKSGTVYVAGKQTNSSAARIIVSGFIGFFGLMFGGGAAAFALFYGLFTAGEIYFDQLPQYLPDPIYVLIYIVGLACALAMTILYGLMQKRTTYGNEMLGKLRGLKNFLETAEKPRLEELVIQDPTYFYNILPFTYVLGVSDKWIKQFETIALQAPDWYNGTDTFSAVAFGSFMTSTMSSAQSAMSSSPSGDGGGSGSGSSGGGSGGGGGGSW